MKKKIIATRGSRLALAQTEQIRAMLAAAGVETEIKIVKTGGDRNQSDPLRRIGGGGLFVREIEQCLLKGEADLAVHSGKDLPYALQPGLVIGCVPPAADARDCLVTVRDTQLPDRPVLGTGSARRIVQCRSLFPEAVCEEIRGNIDTRLGKLKAGDYDGIFLAKAGLDRLYGPAAVTAGRAVYADLQDLTVRILEPEEMIPAACQGILAVECRAADAELAEILAGLSDPAARARFDIERACFGALQSDCSMPVAFHAGIEADGVALTAMYKDRYCRERFSAEALNEIPDRIKEKLL